jgi:hypothetical protein
VMKDETVILVSSFSAIILPPSSFSPCLCVSVVNSFFISIT